MENIITQVSQDNVPASAALLQEQQLDQNHAEANEDDYGNSLIHLNIQETHYYITRDQLMSLPESLLLCLFPSGVFLDRRGQVITNLTPEDEVYISNFPPDCFEYIMEAYTKAYDDLVNFPVDKIFDRSLPSKENALSSAARGFFTFGGTAQAANNSAEDDILHEKPTIIVLREDLDYYCVPQSDFQFDSPETSDDLLYHVMAQVKAAAGSYLTSKTSIFQGLYSSNRLKKQKEVKEQRKTHNTASIDRKPNEKTLGAAEQHLMDMLCSSGFQKVSKWGNRAQESGKTVISSLSLCRIANESTEEFRGQFQKARAKWEHDVKLSQENAITPVGSTVSVNSLSRSTSHNNANQNTSNALSPAISSTASSNSISNNNPYSRGSRDKRKSRLSTLADNVRSRSSSNNRSSSKQRHQEAPKLYELVPRPDINAKLLLFWRKPARKCWWGEEEINLDVEVYGSWSNEKTADNKRILNLKAPKSPEDGLNKINIPVRLHIRRVWTLELSVVGVQ